MESEKLVTRINTVWLGEDGIARIIHVLDAEALEWLKGYLE